MNGVGTYLSLALITAAAAATSAPATADGRFARHAGGGISLYVDVPDAPRLNRAVVRALEARTGRRIRLAYGPRDADLVARVRLQHYEADLRPVKKFRGFRHGRCRTQTVKARLDYGYRMVLKEPGRGGRRLDRQFDQGRLIDYARLVEGRQCVQLGATPRDVRRGLRLDLADRMAADILFSVRRHGFTAVKYERDDRRGRGPRSDGRGFRR